jgi:glutamine synthetase adenylyltransferase
MENGLQTHSVPADPIRRRLVARRMRFEHIEDFEARLFAHTRNVHAIFQRIFSDENIESSERIESFADHGPDGVSGFVAADSTPSEDPDKPSDPISDLRRVSPRFSELIATAPLEIAAATDPNFEPLEALRFAVECSEDLRTKLAAMRTEWRRQIISIAALDAGGQIDERESKRRQTLLAEASIDVALNIARSEMGLRTGRKIEDLTLAVMGLGKLGGAGVDYGSDLDLILVYDDTEERAVPDMSEQEFYSRTAEIFVKALSGYTLEGYLYRVVLRLRPH